VLKGMITCIRFPSWCNVFDGNVLVLKGNPLCDVVVSNALVLVLKGKLASVDFSYQCNVFIDNMFVFVI
jgi:hypothetical protein